MASQTACCERRGKAQIAAGWGLPENGVVLVSVNDYDKNGGLRFAREMHRMGFRLYAMPGTAAFIRKNSLPVESVNKMVDGSPHTVDLIRNGEVQLVLNTPLGPHAHADGAEIRAAAVAAIQALRQKELHYRRRNCITVVCKVIFRRNEKGTLKENQNGHYWH